MESDKIIEVIKGGFPEDVLGAETFRGQSSVTLKKERVVEICRFLHDEPSLHFDLLKDLCGVDYLGRREVRFEVVYHLYSIDKGHSLRLKVPVAEGDCAIDSVVPVWRGADWHERECFDMYGIKFNGHPDLRRILMPEDWTGHPLRKDYPAKGPEGEWPGFVAVLKKAEEYRQYEWNR